jgi:hypothetical protein
MSTHILHTVFSNWHPRRYLGLIAASFVLSQAIFYKDGLLGVLSAILFFQVIANVGCFGSSGCAVPVQENDPEEDKEIEYTEVK